MDQTRPAKSTQRKVPSFGHFYTLLALILIIVGGVGLLYHKIGLDNQELRDQLADLNAVLKTAQEKQGKKLSGQITAVDVALEESNKRISALQEVLDQSRTDFVEFRTATEKTLGEIHKQQEDIRKAMALSSEELGVKIEQNKAEFARRQEGFDTVVAAINEDSKFIISELGKKAEKAYMKFMERKLKKQIGKVADMVDEVKGELEQKIVSTHERIDKVTGELGTEIQKKVEERVNIEFVPSSSDGEE
jgi:hypothetical protein